MTVHNSIKQNDKSKYGKRSDSTYGQALYMTLTLIYIRIIETSSYSSCKEQLIFFVHAFR